jgi:hypothetical protein
MQRTSRLVSWALLRASTEILFLAREYLRERCAQLHRLIIQTVLQQHAPQARAYSGSTLRLINFSKQKRYGCNKMRELGSCKQFIPQL